jgi:hypothetical protein
MRVAQFSEDYKNAVTAFVVAALSERRKIGGRGSTFAHRPERRVEGEIAATAIVVTAFCNSA